MYLKKRVVNSENSFILSYKKVRYFYRTFLLLLFGNNGIKFLIYLLFY